jgi:phage portal protein BeeE
MTRAWAQPTATPTEFVAGSDFVPDLPAMPGFDPRTAMSAYGSMSWVVACAEIVAADLSRLPIRVTANGKGRGAKPVDHPILKLLQRPYRGTSGAWLRRQWSIDYDLTGTAYGLVLVSGARRQVPVGLMRMHPARTEVAPGDDGVPSRFVYTGNGREVHYNADAVLYFRGASWEDDPRMLYGQGKIRALAKDLATDDALAANTTISAGKGRPDGIVYPDSDTEQWTAAQVKGFREDLDRLLREANGGLAVLGRKLGYQAKWRGETTQMTPTKADTDRRVLRLHDLYAFVLASDDLLEDAPRLNARLTRKASDAIRYKLESGIVNGTGAGQPLGWYRCRATASRSLRGPTPTRRSPRCAAPCRASPTRCSRSGASL